MSQEEFIHSLNGLANVGFLEKKTDPLGLKDDWYVVTAKGMQFYEEHGRFGEEMPADESHLPHWIRFMGEQYVPLAAVRTEFHLPPRSEPLDYAELDARLRAVHDTVLRRGGTVRFNRSRPASAEEVERVERELQFRLPEAFRRALLTYAGKLDFFWSMPGGADSRTLKKEAVFEGYHEQVMDFTERKLMASGGYLDGFWDLERLVQLEEERDGLEYYDDEVRTYWEDSLIICSHGNGGNYFGIRRSTGEVIYLSIHPEMHGWLLGRDFESFLDQWSRVGCSGHWGEDFFLLSGPDAPYIDSESVNGKRVQEWLLG